MAAVIVSDYFYGEESEQFSYFRIPRLLVRSKKFKTLSTDAKLLYGLMLDRMGLSAKHGWYDELGRVYIYYTLDEIQTSVAVNGQDLGFNGYLDIGLYDTMEDLFVNFIGALTFSVFGYFYIKHRGKGRIAKAFIPTITENKKESDHAQSSEQAVEDRDS